MEYYLKIAEMKIVRKPDILKTVVGSCIALCLWDKNTNMGGMVHIMMPYSINFKITRKEKFADLAVDYLLDEMKRSGCKI